MIVRYIKGDNDRYVYAEFMSGSPAFTPEDVYNDVRVQSMEIEDDNERLGFIKGLMVFSNDVVILTQQDYDLFLQKLEGNVTV